MDADFDHLQGFVLPDAGVRGALVRLDASWREVASRADYPPPLRAMLGECLAAVALMTANIKFSGSLSLELKSAGTPGLLFAECSDRGTLRGLARWDVTQQVADNVDLSRLPDAVLAITIGQADGHRHQGLVALEGATPAAVLGHYFETSEQLPTRFVLAADGDQAAGLMLQRLPGAGSQPTVDADGWNRVGHLAATLGAEELLATAPLELIHRLFHEESPQVFTPRPLAFGCACSRQRVMAVLQSLGADEVEAARVASGGTVEVNCEFCAQRYTFDSVDIGHLFAAAGDDAPSTRLH